MTGWTRDDGGRAAAGYKGVTKDCVTRSITIASGRYDYKKVYRSLHAAMHAWADSDRIGGYHRTRLGSRFSPRNGVSIHVYRPWLERYGWTRTPLPRRTTLEEVQATYATGQYLLIQSNHATAMVDGELHDMDDPAKLGGQYVLTVYTPPPVTP